MLWGYASQCAALSRAVTGLVSRYDPWELGIEAAINLGKTERRESLPLGCWRDQQVQANHWRCGKVLGLVERLICMCMSLGMKHLAAITYFCPGQP